MILKHKVILVTGGASGIGLACVEEFLKNDSLGIAIVDCNFQQGITVECNLNQKYGSGKVIFIKADVANKEQLQGAFKKTIDTFEQLDIVFNNAGVSNENNNDLLLEVNFKGSLLCLKLAIDDFLPKYKSTKDALLINTASIAGLDPTEGIEVYSATKAGVVSLTRSFGNDYHYRRTGVNVIGICPGGTQTDMLENIEDKLFYKNPKPKFLESASELLQTAEDLAKCLVRIMSTAENGSVWTIIMGKETKVIFPKYVDIC